VLAQQNATVMLSALLLRAKDLENICTTIAVESSQTSWVQSTLSGSFASLRMTIA